MQYPPANVVYKKSITCFFQLYTRLPPFHPVPGPSTKPKLNALYSYLPTMEEAVGSAK